MTKKAGFGSLSYFYQNLYMPDSNTIYIILVAIIVAGLLFFFYYSPQKSDTVEKQTNTASVALQLQAYERLTLLVDRIALPNLISRSNHEGLSARAMQLVLTRTIRDEFDYNITQQIYIAHGAWQAVRNLKENNLLIINQVSAQLPPEASGLDLNRALLEFLMQDNKANMHELVGEVLSFEVKKLL